MAGERCRAPPACTIALSETIMRKPLTPAQKLHKKQYNAAHYLANRERYRSIMKSWTESNKVKIIEDCKIYYIKNKELIKARSRKRHHEKRDEILEKKRAYVFNNRDVINEKNREKYRTTEIFRVRATNQLKEWKRNNPEKHKISQQAYQDRNREKINAKSAAWRVANPEFGAIYKHRRRARLLGCDEHHTSAEWRAILKAHGNKCYWCSISGTKDNPLSRDHYIPLSKGGSNAARNIVPCCMPCNLKKNAKDPLDFARSKGLLL